MEISTKADDYGNDKTLEELWAFKAFHHSETYFNLISSVDSRLLKLTKFDDEIYKELNSMFPDLKVDVMVEKDLKTKEAKDKWRPFCNRFEDEIDDFNFGTLLRLDCTKDYEEDNSVLVMRIQFYAIEVARNRKGLNTAVWKTKRKETKEEVDEDKTKDEESGQDIKMSENSKSKQNGDAAS